MATVTFHAIKRLKELFQIEFKREDNEPPLVFHRKVSATILKSFSQGIVIARYHYTYIDQEKNYTAPCIIKECKLLGSTVYLVSRYTDFNPNVITTAYNKMKVEALYRRSFDGSRTISKLQMYHKDKFDLRHVATKFTEAEKKRIEKEIEKENEDLQRKNSRAQGLRIQRVQRRLHSIEEAKQEDPDRFLFEWAVESITPEQVFDFKELTG